MHTRTTENHRRSAMLAAAAHAVTVSIASMLGSASAIGQPASPVRTAEVTLDTVQDHRRVTGSLRAVARSAVASQEPGQLAAITIDEGMSVRQGDLLARLDDRRLRAQVLEAEASLERAESQLTEMKAEEEFAAYEHGRVKGLFDRRTAAEREFQEATSVYHVAQARRESAQRAVNQAQRTLELLRIRLGDMEVKAPYDAQVVRRHVDVGEWVEPGEPIVELVSTGTIEARLEVPERYAEAVHMHADRIYAEVAGLGSTQASLEVRMITDVDPRARTFSVILTLDNRDGLAAPGMSVNAWIPTTERTERLTAPKDAVIRNGRDAYVLRAAASENGEATAVRTPVRVLFDWDKRLVLESETLSAGDRVIVEGNERLMPGATVALAGRR